MYFSSFIPDSANEYYFAPKLDEEIERKLARQRITRKLRCAIDISRMSGRDMGRGISLSRALELGRSTGADHIEITVSARGKRERGLIRSGHDFLTSLRRQLGRDPESINRLEVSGKEGYDSKTEVLDLIAHRLMLNFRDVVAGPDLRFPRNVRWLALRRAFDNWRELLT